MSNENEDNSENLKINIMTLGDSTVGKSCFIIRYTENTFMEVYLSSIGIDSKIKNITLNDKSYTVYFYDTTGQERFKSMALNTVKNADGIILMYDITKRISYDSINKWMKDIKEMKEEDFPILLLGNKIDLEERRQVNKEEGQKLANEFNIDFYEISNKDGTNINEAGLCIIQKVIESNAYNQKKKEMTITKTKTLKKKKNKCC